MVSLLGSCGGTTSDIILYDCAWEYQWHNVTSFLQRSEGRDFVLEKDGDSGHGKAKTSQYSSHLEEEKQAGGLLQFCPVLPIFSHMESCWQTPKQPLAKCKISALEWSHHKGADCRRVGASLSGIHERCRLIPKRLWYVLDGWAQNDWLSIVALVCDEWLNFGVGTPTLYHIFWYQCEYLLRLRFNVRLWEEVFFPG